MSHRKFCGGRAAAAFFIVLLCALAGGCSLHPQGELTVPPSLPRVVSVDGVPFYPQKEYQCGPATLAMALTWSGLPTLPDELTESVYTPSEKGSLQMAMIGATRRHGRVAYVLGTRDALLTELSAGHPVVLLLNLGLSIYPVWHYAIAIGYDQPTNTVILRSGEEPLKRYSFDLLDILWARSGYWGLLTMPPDQLPASTEVLPWLKGVLGLEQVKDWSAAYTGYRTATQRWPEAHAAWMGLGNTSYALDRKLDAADAFETATRLAPDDGMAFNNLATVLSDLGRYDEAVAAARQAVACGGPHAEIFARTLSEVLQKRLTLPSDTANN